MIDENRFGKCFITFDETLQIFILERLKLNHLGNFHILKGMVIEKNREIIKLQTFLLSVLLVR